MNKSRPFIILRIFAILIIISSFTMSAENIKLEDIYPVIKSLLPGDPNLKQLQGDVEFYYRQSRSLKELPPLNIYLYTVTDQDSLFTLSARFNLPYEALATLNHLKRIDSLQPEQILLVPSVPGLFIPAEPEGDLELFINSWREQSLEGDIYRVLTSRGEEEFKFIPGEKFHSIERAFFLGILYHSPLRNGRLTSDYGWRTSPISGERHFHNGIDLAAPRGTEVTPAREGVVSAAGWDDVYGNYVAVSHEGGYVTFYGHLDSITVELNQTVSSTMIIGRVGDTGLSTGPHLHFALRSPNGSFDPKSFLSGVER